MSEKTVACIANTVRYKKIDGTLSLLSNKITWSATNGVGKNFQCLYSEIKMQRISPESSSKVQLQIVLHTESSYNFQFVNPKGRAAQLKNRNEIKDLLAELIPAHREKANKDLEEKNKLLKENSDLYQLYKDLVVTGIITAEEFWENQKSVNTMACSSASSEKQKVGIASGLLAELKPDMHGCNELRFNLTADSIDAIFKMYPAVKKKYVASVPDEMSEKEFWTEFFQSQHFHRDRIPKNNQSNKDTFGELAKKDEQESFKKFVTDFYDPLIDFSSTCPITEEGYGTSEVKRHSSHDTLIKHFNHQSFMILQEGNNRVLTEKSAETDRKRKRIREAVELDELENHSQEFVSTLKIVDTDKFFHGQEAVYENGNKPCSKMFIQSILTWKPDLGNVLSAKPALSAMTNVSPGGKYMLISAQNSTFVDNISLQLYQETRKNYLSLAELLRHFWSCFPIKTAQLEEKVQRMASSLEKFRQTKLLNFSTTLSPQNTQLIDHMNDMISTALKKFITWEEKRTSTKISRT
ncbi:general transcription factor IIH subunit 1 isoform X1 [Hydra vulgaris]|uniref:General transcription factor IIH subunit 1 isoform X1 n=1 Tax=Hydra vulgaris TaxID=6087 RepID=A0ABM4BET1_HYDVU